MKNMLEVSLLLAINGFCIRQGYGDQAATHPWWIVLGMIPLAWIMSYYKRSP